MKFSTRTYYGLRAVLVLAARFGEGSLSVSQISLKEGISTPYLEQILNALKKRHFVKSVRGPQGGYVLAKKPSEITLQELLMILEEDKVFPVSEKPAHKADLDEISLANWIFWRKFQTSLEEGLSKITLKELLDEARRLKKTKSVSLTQNFQI